MTLKEKYYKLFYDCRIHEFRKIDIYKNWTSGKSRNHYQSIRQFYLEELEIGNEKLVEIEKYFEKYKVLYTRYYNDSRKKLFQDPDEFLKWYDHQNDSCQYCGIRQSELQKIVNIRGGNLTLNNKSKRSKGTLEIEKMDPNYGYTINNCVLACPFCNNAKSNLISASDWREYFVPSMKKYIRKAKT